MADEYGYSENRKSKRDQKKKRQNRVYKRGGPLRGMNVSLGNKKK